MNPTWIGLGSKPEIRGEMPVWHGTASSYRRKDKGKGKGKNKGKGKGKNKVVLRLNTTP